VTTTVHRIFNFSSGPAVLPLPVLEEVQRDLVALPGVGMSVMEISHRSRVFDEILERTVADIRDLAGLGDEYEVLLLQGGASLQFLMAPMNLMTPGGAADYVDTGTWAVKAIEEARRVGSVRVAASTREEGYRRVPGTGELDLAPDPAYVHITTNNTIEGTEYHEIPEVGPRVLVADASSNIFSRPLDYRRFGLVYAGAQKNLGPAGVTLVLLRRDLLGRSSDTLPAMLDYRTHVSQGSRYNTPNTFGIYVLGLTIRWIRSKGALEGIGRLNDRKAGKLYDEIDRTGFWQGAADAASRSRMNVTFRMRDAGLEPLFLERAEAAGFDGLKGHRSVGGLRAGLYNAFPEDGVDALVSFMQEFERTHG
jgi:phosphoserine aminotransferase